MRLFQRDAYISVDFLDKKTEIIRLDTNGQGKSGNSFDIPVEMGNGEQKILSVSTPEIPSVNAIRMELLAFATAVIRDQPVKVSAFDGYQAMEVAHQILKKMSLHNKLHNE